MAKKIVTLYIDDTSLRVMVTQGRQIKEWAEAPLEPGLVENNVVVNEAEVAARIKQLFGALKIKAGKVNLGVSGLRCLTRPVTLPRLPNEMLEEAVKREAKGVLPVPLEQIYISWQIIPAPEGKTGVFLVAIPCKTADALVRVLHQAGLEPGFMGIKPLLLARLVREATAVIVDVGKTEFDIVIMVDGVPQPIRTVPFLDGWLPWQEKLTTVINELNRTLQFHNANNPEKVLGSSVPVFASGELADEPELSQAVAAQLEHPVFPLPSPLECPQGFQPGRFMVNIGLAFQKLSSRKEAGPSVADLNALPAPYRPKPISLTNILALPGAVVAAGLLVFLVMLIQSASADIASMRTRLNTTEQFLQQQLSQKQELVNNINQLEGKIIQAEAARDGFAAALGRLERQSSGMNHDLEITLENQPDSVTMSSVSHAEGLLTINGRAPSEKEVILYLRKLDSSGRFGEITITSMSRVEGEGMDFTLLGSLERQSDGASSIELAVGSLPAGTSLSSASYTNGTLTINGQAPDEDRILSYLEGLEASGKFAEITITRMSKIEGGGMDFSLFIKVGG